MRRSEESQAPSVYCGGCGNTIGESAKFCPSCGAEQAQFLDAVPGNPTTLSPVAPAPPSTTAARQQEAQSPANTASAATGGTPTTDPPAQNTSAPSAAPLVHTDSAAAPGRGSLLASPWRTPEGHRRSVAWIYYALIAVGALIAGFQHPAFLLAAVVAGLYSTYLFRGGRFVIWFW